MQTLYQTNLNTHALLSFPYPELMLPMTKCSSALKPTYGLLFDRQTFHFKACSRCHTVAVARHSHPDVRADL